MLHGKVCKDAVSRQAAIDALKEHRALYCDNTPDAFSKLSYAEKSRVDELDTAIATLVNLPSVQPKPCEDAVSRADVLECFADLYDAFEDCSKGIINELHRKFEDLRALPSVTPKRKTGEWRVCRLPDDWVGTLYRCNQCGNVEESPSHFCPHCGLLMEVEE